MSPRYLEKYSTLCVLRYLLGETCAMIRVVYRIFVDSDIPCSCQEGKLC